MPAPSTHQTTNSSFICCQRSVEEVPTNHFGDSFEVFRLIFDDLKLVNKKYQITATEMESGRAVFGNNLLQKRPPMNDSL